MRGASFWREHYFFLGRIPRCLSIAIMLVFQNKTFANIQDSFANLRQSLENHAARTLERRKKSLKAKAIIRLLRTPRIRLADSETPTKNKRRRKPNKNLTIRWIFRRLFRWRAPCYRIYDERIPAILSVSRFQSCWSFELIVNATLQRGANRKRPCSPDQSSPSSRRSRNTPLRSRLFAKQSRHSLRCDPILPSRFARDRFQFSDGSPRR